MTKEVRISKFEAARKGLLAFHWSFGFRYSFDIRHSDFVIIQSPQGRGQSVSYPTVSSALACVVMREVRVREFRIRAHWRPFVVKHLPLKQWPPIAPAQSVVR